MKFEGHGREEGKFTHFLFRVLRNYFAAENEQPIPIETYPTLVARISSAGKDEFDTQHPVCFVGETMKTERIFSHSRAPHQPSLVTVEATKLGGQMCIGTGFIGMLLASVDRFWFGI